MTAIRATILLTVLMTAFAADTAVGAVATAPALPAGKLLLDGRPENFKLMGQSAAMAEANVIDVRGAGQHKRGWRIEVRERAKEPWAIQLAAPITGDAPKRGDIVLLTLWARTIRSTDETNAGTLAVTLEQSAEPFAKAFAAQFSVGSDWQRIDVPAKVGNEFASAQPRLSIRLGFAPQTIEIGGVELRNFGTTVDAAALPRTLMTYAGREANAPWRTAANQRIEQLRKCTLTVRVTDAAGQPVANAKVQVHMTRHAFPFGCVYNAGRIVGAIADQPDSKTYRDRFVELFNFGVDEYAMKWPSWDEPSGREAALKSLTWMNEHNIPVRAHCMVWPSWRRTPEGLKTLANDPPALRERIADHIRDVGTALAGRVEEWDVVNEPYANNDLLKILGDDVMSEWFTLAREADPTARLYLNETGVPTSVPTDPRYDVLFNQVRHLQEQGAPIGGVGMQAHFGGSLNPPANLLSIYDRFATLSIPVRITELDVDVSDEQLQADYLRDVLIASFSHPNINGVLLWGFWEGHHWRPNAALWRKDWSIKPAGQAWLDLVRKKWWTNADGTTGSDGTYATRGFLGTYEITVTAAGKPATAAMATLTRKGSDVTVRLGTSQ